MAVRTRAEFQGIYPDRMIGHTVGGAVFVDDWNDVFDSVLMLEDSGATGRTLLAAATAAAARTALSLGTMAVEAAADYLAKAGGTMSGALIVGTGKGIWLEPSTPAIVQGSGGYFGWAAGADATAGLETYFTRYGAGKVALSGTTPMLALGGASSSYPAWKRSTTFLEARLADDTAGAGVLVGDGASGAPSISFGAHPTYGYSYDSFFGQVCQGTGGYAMAIGGNAQYPMIVGSGAILAWATAALAVSGAGFAFGAGLVLAATGVVGVTSGDASTWRDLRLRKLLDANGVQVVTARETGWTAPTGTAQKTGYATASGTLADALQTLKSVVDALISHGLIGA